MLRRLLTGLGHAAVSRPLTVIGLSLLPAILLSLYALRVPVDLSFTGIMNRADPEVARYFETSRRYRLGGSLLLLLEGPEPQLDDAIAGLIPVIEGDPSVREVIVPEAGSWVEERLPWLVDRPLFDAWLSLVDDPLDRDNAARLSAGLEELATNGSSWRRQGARVLQVRLEQDPLDVPLGGTTFFALKQRVEEHLAGSPIRPAFSGLPALGAEDQTRTLGIIERLSPLSLLVVLLLFRFVERRWLGLAAVVLPLVLAVGATLGLVGLLVGQLTVMETFFGVTVFGLGIDFAVHLIVRQREERARGRPFSEALERTLAGTGRGVVAGAVTTAGAFLIVALAPDPLALHLGLSGGIGLLVCLALMLSLLPAIWVLLERRRSRRHPHRDASTPLPMPAVSAVAAHAVRHPRLHLGLAAGLILTALLGAPRFTTETDLEQVFNRQVPSLETTRRIQELFAINGAPWIIGVQGLEEARRITDRLAADPLFVRAESAANLLPDDADERSVELESRLPLLRSRLALVEQLDPGTLPVSEVDLGGYREALAALERAAKLGPPSLEGLPEELRGQLLGPRGELLVYAYPRHSALDGAEARAQRLAAQAVHPEATGLGALLEAIMVAERPWIRWVAGGILLFVGLILLIDLRDPRLALLALLPVMLGVAITFGVLCWLGISFNVMTTLVVPLIVGLGVDDGIHVVHRIRERVDRSLDRAAAAVGRAVVMTTATTSSSFAILLLTDHPGLESMGLVMLIGLPVCLLASVTTLPAAAALLLPREPET